MKLHHFPVAVAVLSLAATSTLSAATLTLTAAGIADNFSLTTFATINPGANGNTGPFGLTLTGGGTVLVNNYIDATRYAFADVDGQTPATALNVITGSTSQAEGYAIAGGQAYGGNGAQFVEFNADGTVNHTLTGVTDSPWFGMWGIR